MQKAFLVLALGLSMMSLAKAGDDDKTPSRAEKPRTSDDSKKESHGFFHPFSKFFVHTVGGNIGGGLKSGAGDIKQGIGGGKN